MFLVTGLFSSIYESDPGNLTRCIGEPWEPNHEILEMQYFARDELRAEMGYAIRTRTKDASNQEKGIVRVFKTADLLVEI